MGDPRDFIDPIIQAMMGSQQRAINVAQLAQRAKESKEDLALRQQQQKDAELKMQQEHEYQTATLDNATKLLVANLKQQQLDRMKQMQDIAANGGDIQKAGQYGLIDLPPGLSGSTPSVPTSPQSPLDYKNYMQNGSATSLQPNASNPTAPTLNNAAPNLISQIFGSPQARLALIRANAAAQSGGAAEGALPAKLNELKTQNDYETARQNAKNEFEKQQLNQQQVFQAGENAKNRTNQLNIANMSKATQMAVASLENSTRLKQIGAEYGLDPSTATGLALDIFGGGQKADINNPVMRRLIGNGEAAGFKNPGTDIDQLKSLDKAEAALGNYQDFVNNYLSDKKVMGVPVGSIGTRIAGAAPWSTEAKTAQAALAANLQSVGHEIEGYPNGRALSGQFAAESSTAPNLADTKANGQRKIDSLKKNINQQRATILKNYNPAQIELFKQQNPGLGLGSSYPTSNKQLDWNKDVIGGQP